MRSNIGFLTIGNAGALLIGFVITAYLARVLGKETFGNYSYAQTIASYGVLIVDLGFNVYGTRATAATPEGTGPLVRIIVSLQGVAATAVIAAAVLLTHWLPQETGTLVVVSLFWTFTYALNVEWVYLGLQRMGLVGMGRLVQQLVTLSLTFIFIHGPQQVVGAVVFRLLGGVGSAMLLLSRLPTPRSTFGKISLYQARLHLSSAQWFWYYALFLQVSRSSDILILKQFGSLGDIGAYAAAGRLTALSTSAVALLNTVMFSMLSREATSNHTAFSRIRRAHLLSAGVLAFASVVVGIPFASTIVVLVYGSHYAGIAGVVRILVLAGALLVVQGAVEQPLLAAGYERQVLIIIILTAAVSVGLNLVLIPTAGVYGAALTYLVSAGFSLALLTLLYRRRLGALVAGQPAGRRPTADEEV